MPRLILSLAAMLMAGSAFAQPAPGFDALSACRMDAAQAEISFAFQGSACIGAQEAQVTDAGEQSLAVRVPFRTTAEMCIMSMVPVEVTQAIGVQADTIRLSVTAVDADGNVLAQGETGLAETPDCVEKAGP